MSKGITFTDYAEAVEYVKRKAEEGYRAEICGSAKRGKHVVKVIGRIEPGTPKRREQFSPYRQINPLLANDTILRQFKKEGKPPLRTKEYIERLATKMMEEASVPTIDVRVTSERGMGKYTDAEVKYYEYQEKGRKKIFPFRMIIHPIHQYSNKEELVRTIEHEIRHIKERG